MEANKRRGAPPVPDDVDALLAASQLRALSQLHAFGWKLYVVRRPKFLPVQVVLEHESGKYAVLTPGGELDHSPSLRLRREVIKPEEVDESNRWAYGNTETRPTLQEIPGDATIVSNEPVPKPAPGPGAGKDRPVKKILV